MNISADTVVKIEEYYCGYCCQNRRVTLLPSCAVSAVVGLSFSSVHCAVSVPSVSLLYCRRLPFLAVDLRCYFPAVAVCLRIAPAPQ